MQSLTVPRRKDPSPSRLKYRLERIWLTPIVRKAVLRWIPVGSVVLALSVVASDPRVHRDLDSAWQRLRDSIAARPELQVRQLEIEGATPEIEPELRRLLALNLPVSSLDIELPDIRRQIEARDAVKTAEVRLERGVLRVVVEPRVAVAVWRTPDALWTVDNTGRRVQEIQMRTAAAGLPLIAGDGAETEIQEALALYRIAQPLAERLRGIVRMGNRRWDIVLDRNQRILLPEAGAANALRRILGIHNAEDLLNRDLSVVDARDPGRITLRLNPNAVSELRRLRNQPPGEDA